MAKLRLISFTPITPRMLLWILEAVVEIIKREIEDISFRIRGSF